jgi:hypothetical protein
MFAALRSAEWSHMRDYVSGAFFDVLPATDLAKEVAKLSRNTTRRRVFEARRAELGQQWANTSPTVVPTSSLIGTSLTDSAPIDEETRTAIGDATLAAFFRIALGGGDVLLDLRPSRLAWSNDELEWAPGRLWTTWDRQFSQHVAGLYRGFYGDDDALFDQALEGLGLSSARAVLRKHFGEEDQRAVAFELETFHATFHEVFVSCRDSGASLHRGFVTLGLLLACLYETLEFLGGTFDVRAAFERTVSS